MTAATKTLPGMSAAHAAEHERLLTRVEAHRDDVPCLGPDAGRWLSDDKHDQAAAATACLACPILVPCRAYAVRNGEDGAVYGGQHPRELTTQHRHYRAALDDLGDAA